MTLPRLSIATLMVVVAVVAIDVASIRAFHASRSLVPSPAWVVNSDTHQLVGRSNWP
jgi:hypothetical protein